MNKLIVAGLAAVVLAPVARADDWPQWMGPKRDGVWRETGIIDKFPEKGPKELWRKPIGSGYSGPAVAAGRVYVMDRVSAQGAPNPGDLFTKKPIEGSERVLCLDRKNGETLWKHEYPCTYAISYAFGPRCTPTVDGKHVYTLGAMGDLFCLDAAKGSVVWSKDFKKDYGAAVPMWGYSGHPLVVGEKLICMVGGKGSTAVAFDKATGKELWKALDAKEIGYAPPSLIEVGGKPQLVIWHGEAINGLDPETGKELWSEPLNPQHAMSIMTPRQKDNFLFAGGMINQSLLLKLGEKPEVVWRGGSEKGIGPVNSTPFIEGDYLYGVDREGELRCVKLATGERVWETFAATTGKGRFATATAFLVKNGDRFFLFNDTGELMIAKLTPEKYEEIGRAKLLEPLTPSFGTRNVVWSYPAFAEKCVFARNDKEIVCVSLAAE